MEELLYIKGPREEGGRMGPHQMGLADIPERRRQVVAIKRQEERRKAGERRKRKLEESVRREQEVNGVCLGRR